MIQYTRCGHTRPWCDGVREINNFCPACREARIGAEIKFVRFGAPVKQSTNHQTGCAETGMSVYEIGVGTIRSEFADRPAYTGRGVIVGYGSDDEPLVRAITCRRATKSMRSANGWK